MKTKKQMLKLLDSLNPNQDIESIIPPKYKKYNSRGSSFSPKAIARWIVDLVYEEKNETP